MKLQKLAGLTALLCASTAFAGGPLNLNPNDPDNVERWAGGGANIPYNPDQGGLGPQDNATAVANVDAAFAAWQAIPTATSTYVNNGLLPVDVDETNFAVWLPAIFGGPLTADGLSPIVFDEDGALFDALFGPNSGVLGFATPDILNADGVPIEGNCFLNGGPMLDDFPEADFFGVEVHEFGHYSGLAHTVVNGQNIAFGDETGPTPNNAFGDAPLNQVETMYPFAIVGGGESTPHADDIAMLSSLYPAAGFFANRATVTGTILAPNGTTPLTGVNVIARNVADPFVDAVSSISGDRGIAGVYTLNGLTPGASYVLYIDQILAGGFSTPPISLPGPEEFYNGGNESADSTTDDPAEAVAVATAAGATTTGIDVILNTFSPGDALPVGDDGFVELFPPFDISLCGQSYASVFVNANGNVTFGAPSGSFIESTFGMLAGPARIAALWDDLNPAESGTVTFDVRNRDRTFVVSYENVPEFSISGGAGFNSFEIVIHARGPLDLLGNFFEVRYGDMTAVDGLAGFSCGAFATSTFETPTDLSRHRWIVNAFNSTAEFELFNSSNPNDLSDDWLLYLPPRDFKDRFERNNSFRSAKRISLPFDTIDTKRFTEIDLVKVRRDCGEIECDVDYYRFSADAGHLLTVDMLAGGIDSMIAVYDEAGNQLAFDDDGQGVIGGLSRISNFPIPADGDYVLAVTTWPDFEFDGIGGLGGEGRYVLDVFTVIPPPGNLLPLGDDTFVEVPLGFSFPYQGDSYSSVFVNSNGNLSFGAGSGDFSETVGEFLSGPPRIAPLWDDLSPNQGGFVSVLSGTGELTVFFQDVPQFLAGDSNNFSVTLRSDGSSTVSYGAVDAVDAVVGVTPGGGIAGGPGAVDLSSSPSWSATGSTYEQFTTGSPFDLELSIQNYDP